MDDVSSTVNDAAEAAVAAAGADESAAAAAAGEHKFQRGNKHGGVRQDNMSLVVYYVSLAVAKTSFDRECLCLGG